MSYRGFEIATQIEGFPFRVTENGRYCFAANTISSAQLWIDCELQRRRRLGAI